MKYSLVLKVDTEKANELFEVAAVEAGKKDRSGIEVERADGPQKGVIFKVSSKDATSMRASLNIVIKILQIFEKTRELVENGNGKGDRREDPAAPDL
jgi:tRNA threonylcarbamoyladenosine modification (KEOPS) complex  Pcc1 subunit